ncbi:lambdaTry [Carabus blaptoides fortunei]
MSPISIVVLALCGLAVGTESQVPRLDGRIVGGDPTTVEELPYQLSLRKRDYHWCGASIISPYHALTAAHCISNGSPDGVSMHAGTSYQNVPGSKHNAVKITIHPQYQGSDYDYAIVEVDTPFPIGQSGVQSIELCSVEPSAGENAVISGWGALSVSIILIIIYLEQICQSLKGF